MSRSTVIRHQNLTEGVKDEHLPQSRFSGKPDDAVRTNLVCKLVIEQRFARLSAIVAQRAGLSRTSASTGSGKGLGKREMAAVHLDAMDRTSIEAMIEHTRATWGALHVLHNNVGGTDVSRDTTLTGMDWSCWDGAINLNLTSTAYAPASPIPLTPPPSQTRSKALPMANAREATAM